MSIDTRNKRHAAAQSGGFGARAFMPVPDGAIAAADRAHLAWAYPGYEYAVTIVTVQNPTQRLHIRLLDKNGDLSRVLDRVAMVGWEYNRKGGCGQCAVVANVPHDEIELYTKPGTRIEVSFDGELRYSGTLLRPARQMKPGSEAVSMLFYGYLAQLSKIIVNEDFADMEVSLVVKQILDDFVVGQCDVTYDEADIEETDYSVASIALNHTVKDAMTFLADLGGSIEWGVDRNKKFFFKRTDPEIRRAFVVGREVSEFAEERDDENVVNVLRMHGANGVLLSTIPSSMSIAIYGEKTANVFESSISEVSDANRYGTVLLKKLSSALRLVRFKAAVDDAFLERTLPMGATTLSPSDIRDPRHYGATVSVADPNKYGTRHKYGGMKRDQVSRVLYALEGGGLVLDVIMQNDVPNIGDQQKRIEYEIKELQRR